MDEQHCLLKKQLMTLGLKVCSNKVGLLYLLVVKRSGLKNVSIGKFDVR